MPQGILKRSTRNFLPPRRRMQWQSISDIAGGDNYLIHHFLATGAADQGIARSPVYSENALSGCDHWIYSWGKKQPKPTLEYGPGRIPEYVARRSRLNLATVAGSESTPYPPRRRLPLHYVPMHEGKFPQTVREGGHHDRDHERRKETDQTSGV